MQRDQFPNLEDSSNSKTFVIDPAYRNPHASKGGLLIHIAISDPTRAAGDDAGFAKPKPVYLTCETSTPLNRTAFNFVTFNFSINDFWGSSQQASSGGDHDMKIIRLIGVSVLSIVLTNCDKTGPVPRIESLSADVGPHTLRARINPNGTVITKVQYELGRRPSLEHAKAILWTENASQHVVKIGNDLGLTGPPLSDPFEAWYHFYHDWYLTPGEVIDYHVVVTYKRPGELSVRKLWSADKSVTIGQDYAQGTQCQLDYRRSTGPLEEDPNMAIETMKCYAIKQPEDGKSPNEWPIIKAVFDTFGHWGALRTSSEICTSSQSCYGSHGRWFKNMGRNTLNIKVGDEVFALLPDEERSVRGDIKEAWCEKFVDPEAIRRAICSSVPDESICQN